MEQLAGNVQVETQIRGCNQLVTDATLQENSRSEPIRTKQDMQPLELLRVERVWYVYRRFCLP